MLKMETGLDMLMLEGLNVSCVHVVARYELAHWNDARSLLLA